MYSENSVDNQNQPARSFIEEARRTQIVAAAIATLAEVGYAKASFAQIAKRAQISTSLIPYHFNNKEDLIYQTLDDVATSWNAHVQREVDAGKGASEQLRIYIESSLAYMGTRPTHYAALVEIIFNARLPDGTPLYLTNDEDPAVTLLKSVLVQGQRTGKFRSFDVHHMAIAINGAIGEFFGEMHKPHADLEAYTAEVVQLFALAVRNDAS